MTTKKCYWIWFNGYEYASILAKSEAEALNKFKSKRPNTHPESVNCVTF